MAITHKTYIIVSHTLVYGAAHALRDYLLSQKKETVAFITHPLTNDTGISTLTIYVGGEKILTKSRKDFWSDSLLSYIETFILTVWWILRYNLKYDVFIGVNNLNGIAGILFRKLEYAKKVVYYSIDFTPQRFRNSLINLLYHWLEVYCVKQADVVWNTSNRIAEGRKDYLGISPKEFKQFTVPIGVWNDSVIKYSITSKNRYRILFLGHLTEKQGVQKIIEAMPAVLKLQPKCMLLIIGDGPFKNTLIDKAKELRVESKIVFHGWEKDRNKLDYLIGNNALALAPYKTSGKTYDNFTYYADPTKIKDYLSAGLPVILTNVSYNALEIEKNNCGIVVEYNPKSIADAVNRLLVSEAMLNKYRSNALLYAQSFDWAEIFNYAIKTIKE